MGSNMDLEADFSQIRRRKCLPPPGLPCKGPETPQTFSVLLISTSAITQPSWPRLLFEPAEGSTVTLPQVHLIFTSPPSGSNCGLPALCTRRYLSANSPFLLPLLSLEQQQQKKKMGFQECAAAFMAAFTIEQQR